MAFDYFYGQQSEQFSFYRVPKLLFTEERFQDLSTDARLLYGVLLDRMDLSAKNQWLDSRGRVYIIFTIEDIKTSLHCGEKKVVKLLDELERTAGLIERKRQGLGKPNLIYVKNFVTGYPVGQFQNGQKDNSGMFQNAIPEPAKGQGNHTDSNNTEYSETDPFLSSVGGDGTGAYERYCEYFSDQLEIELLKLDHPYDRELLDNILELIVETMCSKRKLIRIASDDKPIEIVRSRMMKLDAEHIKFVVSCFKENTTKIKNIRQYLLASIYNAPLTMEGYYDALVRHDMHRGEEGR